MCTPCTCLHWFFISCCVCCCCTYACFDLARCTKLRWCWWPLASAEVHQLPPGHFVVGHGRVEGPTGRRRTKRGVSGPAEDLLPVSEVEAEAHFRLAGGVRRQVVGHIPGRQPGSGTRRVREGAVTPSLHPEVPDTQCVSPGRGLGIRRSRGSGC